MAKLKKTIKLSETSDLGREVSHDYHTSELETPKVKIDTENHGGEAEIVRQYKIKLMPVGKDQKAPTRSELIAHHGPAITDALWRDGWEITGAMKGLEKEGYFYIFAPARIRRSMAGGGAAFTVDPRDRVNSLKDLLAKPNTG